jgi:hypothetical protein
MRHPEELLKLAAWYRDFAEKAANPVIWDARLRMAEELESEAAQHHRQSGGASQVESSIGRTNLTRAVRDRISADDRAGDA